MHKAIIMIDSDLIEAADAQPEKAKPTAFKPWMKYAVAAVMIAVFAIGTPVALNMAGVFGTNNVVDPASSGSGSGSDVSEVIYPPEDDSHSTVSEPPQPITPASTGDVGSYEEPGPDLPHGGDLERWTNYKYLAYDNSLDKLTSIGSRWANYVLEQTGKDIMTLWDTKEWYDDDGVGFSLIEIVKELNVPKEKFIELNNQNIEEMRRNISKYGIFAEYSTAEEMIYSQCFTDEEIDIIYSGDKKRIAEAFASPWAVLADDWEIYPLRWIINNPASVYKERHISLDALVTAADRLLNSRYRPTEVDCEAILARIEEYRGMQ